MARNRELLLYLLLTAAVAAAASALCFLLNKTAGFLCLAACLCLFLFFLVFTLLRYRRIAVLSAYLRRISHGEKALDVRDNAEGELSILKNEIFKVAAALNEQAARLAKDQRKLANALADISHQLKTPLTALGVMTDLLDDDSLPPQNRREFLENIRKSLSRMEWLILTLLKMARLDASAAGLKHEPVPLPVLVERALSPLLIPAEVRGQTVSASGEDVIVYCDLEWTAEALGNILKNAVESTPAGGHIAVTYGKNPLYTFIAVRDGGPGVDKDDLPHLFKRFYRGKNTGPESAGIGLSLSLAVMRRQNGDIEVENDHGAVFTLKFYY
ncbi:MAG: HAMP domain-containing histidine kinase [Clostridiales bacterium]|nr:HAMP domain-containing histidine kinase [Clostridiales bacterium]